MMFYDDVSAIPSDGCNVISSSNTISNYNNNTRKDYVLNGSKWYYYRIQTTNYGSYDISNYNCVDVSTLSSNSMFAPIFYAIAFGLFLVSIVLFFKTVKGFLHVI